MLGAQQLSSSISAARRLLSLPATRAHPAHSAQADWAGSTHLHTFRAHGPIGHVAASATESHGFTQLSLGHVRLFGSQVDVVG